MTMLALSLVGGGAGVWGAHAIGAPWAWAVVPAAMAMVPAIVSALRPVPAMAVAGAMLTPEQAEAGRTSWRAVGFLSFPLLLVAVALLAIEFYAGSGGWLLLPAGFCIAGIFGVVAWWGNKPGTIGRVAAVQAAMWFVGLTANWAASTTLREDTAKEVCTTLKPSLDVIGLRLGFIQRDVKTIKDGVTDVKSDTKEIKAGNEAVKADTETVIDQNKQLQADMAGLREQVSQLQSSLVQTQRQPGGEIQYVASPDDRAAMDAIFKTENRLARSVAYVAKAAESRKREDWNAADSEIALTEEGRRRGYYQEKADEAIYLTLKGDRMYFDDKPDEAIEWYRKATEASNRATRQVLSLAKALGDARRGELAKHSSEALGLYKSLISSRDVDANTRGTALNNAGLLYLEQLDRNRAKEHIFAAYLTYCLSFGPHYQNAASSMGNLGVVLEQEGDLAAALACYTNEERIKRRIFGDEHPEVARPMRNKARVYRWQGRFNDAIRMLKEIEKIDRRHYGDMSESVASDLHAIGGCLFAMGRFEEVLDPLKSARRIYVTLFGENHPNLLAIGSDMASAYAELEEWEIALAICRDVERASTATFGLKHETTLSIIAGTGAILRNKGDCAAALGKLLMAESIARDALPSSSSELALIRNNIGSAYSDMNENSKSLEYHSMAFRSMLRVNGPEGQYVARIAGNLASVGGDWNAIVREIYQGQPVEVAEAAIQAIAEQLTNK